MRYCTDTVTEWEVHRCIRELTPSEQRQRGFSYRLSFDHGRLVRFVRINGRGLPFDEPGELSSDEFSYEGTRVTGWTQLNRNGVLRRRSLVAPDRIWVRWLDGSGRPFVEGTAASGLKRQLDAHGRVLSYAFVDAAGAPTRSKNGVFVVKVVRDAPGEELEESYFDQAGQPMSNQDGVHRIVFTVNALEQPIAEGYYDRDGQKSARNDGVATILNSYDAVGNVTEVRFRDLNGAPHRSKEGGAAGYRVGRDEFGSEITRTYFDESDHPVLSAFGYATRKRQLNADGLPTTWSFYAVDGTPMPVFGHEHGTQRRTLDQRNRTVLQRFFDVDERPLLLPAGYQRIETSYDARDNPILIRYANDRGAPTKLSAGYAMQLIEYDQDREVRRQYLDESGQPTKASNGDMEIVTAFDALGVATKRHLDHASRDPVPAAVPPSK